ncbi:protein phosphatase 2C domain-containing protein [Calothrix sp. PCC 6303]|uniref:protein phosphatase 2C domain-containing protein n=1 Tax=Calothrix sp. PCC 6303 TaxID=1170562 RepID=UPI0002A04D20|nr:protein phosphatase 2C domain-containing protein [Calothrix sp. PCC 6303]AFY99659.1 protein serine/threonine phosphatase [Calothrix sp. PCC 6303]
MIATQKIIYCPNPNCSHPINAAENQVCSNCQTPLIHRYLWSVHPNIQKLEAGEIINDRYEVIKQQIWLDTKPAKLPEIPTELSSSMITYLRCSQEILHLPQIYGYLSLKDSHDILLLENVPIDETGNLYPAISNAWKQATPVRQIYWLWQILQLWEKLEKFGVNGSLLLAENLRVQGCFVRLLELTNNQDNTSIQKLGESWENLISQAQPSIAEQLTSIVGQMRDPLVKFADIRSQINRLLLAASAELPLRLNVAGATDIGAELEHNEDACFPTGEDCIDDPLLPRVSIVCDGIGGHEGGEVASKLGVQSVKLQIKALLTEVSGQQELVSPELLQQQLAASLRIVNNVICNANNEQKREGTQRMGTTMLVAVQVPQQVQTVAGWDAENAHELYIANIGDSRAYWITREYCRLLTLDDDVIAREVCLGRSLYHQAKQRRDATALTQALGTKQGENLRPTVQRLIIEEDGLLLLCSDGLSDRFLVEQSWKDFALPVLDGEMHVEEAVYAWIKLANQKNGHDNISLVLTHCRVSPESIITSTPVEFSPEILETPGEATLEAEESEFSESIQLPLDLDLDLELDSENSESEAKPVKAKKKRLSALIWLLGLLFLLSAGLGLGLFTWWRYNPTTFGKACDRLPQGLQKICPKN